MIKLAPRQLTLAAALALTLAAVAWVATHEDNSAGDDLALTTDKPRGSGKQASQQESAASLSQNKALALKQNQPAGAETQIVDLFKPHAWYVPPPPPPPTPVNVAEQAPVAPPIPFVYLGRLDEAGHAMVFLTRNNLVLSAAQGEMLDSQYRLDTVNAGSLVITYLPLNTKQTIVIKGAS